MPGDFIPFSEWSTAHQDEWLDGYQDADERAMRRTAEEIQGKLTDEEWRRFYAWMEARKVIFQPFQYDNSLRARLTRLFWKIWYRLFRPREWR